MDALGLDSEWVSKTDVMGYYRCPYAFWLVDKGEIEDVLSDARAEFIAQGVQFESNVRSSAIPMPLEPDDLPEFFKGEITLFGLPVLRNAGLQIYGAPDGVKTERGLLLPIEIKSHKNVRPSDRLELAFYWLLLEPHRTKRAAQPQGMLILRSVDGDESRVLVDLKDHDFERVHQLLDDVRMARRDGVTPAVCDCNVCVARPEIIEYVRREKGTTLIWGIARKRAKVLAKMGIRSLQDVLACDSSAVVAHLQKNRHIVSPSWVEGWRHHARSHLEGVPVFFGTEPLVFKSFIAVDLEYVSMEPGTIYLIGAAVVDENAVKIHQWWADEPSEIGANLRQFEELMREYPGVPILTWAGGDAEIPELRKAATLHNVDGFLQPLLDRHLDMFAYAEKNVRLPIPDLDLKRVGRYFGVKRSTEVSGGMMAESLHRKYLRATDESEKKRLQRVLMEYNRDDLESLIQVTRHLRSLAKE